MKLNFSLIGYDRSAWPLLRTANWFTRFHYCSTRNVYFYRQIVRNGKRNGDFFYKTSKILMFDLAGIHSLDRTGIASSIFPTFVRWGGERLGETTHRQFRLELKWGEWGCNFLKISPLLKLLVHQDIQELNRLLFEQLEKSLRNTNEKNLISDLYRGVLRTKVCGTFAHILTHYSDPMLGVWARQRTKCRWVKPVPYFITQYLL